MTDAGILMDAILGFVLVIAFIKLDSLRLKLEESISDNRFHQSLINESVKETLIDVREDIRLLEPEDEK